MKRRYWFRIMGTVAALSGYGLQSGNRIAAAEGPTGTARILVKVVLSGTPRPPAKLQMAADPVCAKQHQTLALSQEIEVGVDGALQDTLVFIKDGGQPVQILNSDPTLHNIHALPVINPGFNIGMPIQGLKALKVFPKVEPPFHVKCDVHGWMSAYIGVFNHPFFGVSNEQGEVELKNLPAGTFQIQAWQETYGVRTQSVTLAAGETKQITFTFKAP